MGKIDIRKLDELNDELTGFQKIKKKKVTETTEPIQVKKAPKRHK